MAIKTYSTTPASNTALFPENMAPSAVNDGMRQVQADIRADYQDSEWRDWGDSGISRASATTFKITGDVTTRYLANRAIRLNDAAILYGMITASSYSAPDTTVTVDLDSGSLTASLTAVAIASLSPTNRSLPASMGRKGADVASATTINLSACGGDFVDVTGTTTITTITSEPKGTRRKVRFTGALTLTHNSTSLQLPGSANITTASGDTAEFISLDGTNWKCFSYTQVSGKALVSNAPFIDTTALIKGSSDATKLLRFEVDGLTTGTTRVWTAPDTDLSQFIVQVAYSQTSAVSTGSTQIPWDTTIPQNTEGDQYLSLSITPKSSSNLLFIEVNANFACSTANRIGTMALFQDTTTDALAASNDGLDPTNANNPRSFFLRYKMTAGTTSSTTFKVRFGANNTGTNTINGAAGSSALGGVLYSSIRITEISP